MASTLAIEIAFRWWVTVWAAEQRVAIVDWWSADLDGDGRPDAVAKLCGIDDQGFYLVEDARGRRSSAVFRTFERDKECRVRPDAPRFRRTRDRVLRHVTPMRRGPDDVSRLVLRNGWLTIVGDGGWVTVSRQRCECVARKVCDECPPHFPWDWQ